MEEISQNKIKSRKLNEYTWYDAEDIDSESLTAIADKHGVYPVHVGEALRLGHIARVEIEDSYIFMLLPIPDYDETLGKVVSRQVTVFLGKDFLLTVHDSFASNVRQVFDSYDESVSKSGHTSAAAFSWLIHNLLNGVDGLVQEVTAWLDEVEDSVFDNGTSDAMQISQLRRRIVRLSRMLVSLHGSFKEFDETIDGDKDRELKQYFGLNTNRCDRLLGVIEEAKETVEIYKDADFTSSQERTNDILAVLTIIFTLSIPATVISAIYGMNVVLPGGIEIGSWTFFGPYTTLIIVLGVAIIPALLMWAYFERKHWF